MKTYLKNLTPEEIIKRLKNGEVIKIKDSNTYYKMIDGIICYYYDKDVCLGIEIYKNQGDDYFETEEPFEIKETGLYKTRDGRKVFVSCITDGDIRPVKGIIQGEDVITSWFLSGEYEQCHKCDEDITSKWED